MWSALPQLLLGMPRNAFGPARLPPRALRIHVVQLHVEDELVAADRGLRRGQLERRLGRQHVAAAARPAAANARLKAASVAAAPSGETR